MKTVFVAGHKGMVGSAIIRELTKDNHIKIITCDRSEVDLVNQAQVNDFFAQNKIEQKKE